MALQILLTVAALLLLVERRIFWGFLCLGLALWNKALMLWTFGGLGVAALLLFPRELRPRRLPAAVLGVILGAFPFVAYNVQTRWETFRQNSTWTLSELNADARSLRYTLDGSGLFGYLVHEDQHTQNPIPARTSLDRAAYWLRETTGRRTGWLPLALVAAVLTLPSLWRTRARTPMLFALIVFSVGWFVMAITKGAGGSVHHSVLLWPFPHLIIAVAAGEWSRRSRWVAAPITVLLLLNLLVLNQYYVQARQNGGANNWSDASLPLAERLMAMKPNAVFLADWGTFDTLRLLGRGSLRLEGLDLNEDGHVSRPLAVPNAVFVVHSPGNESFAGRRAQLLAISEKLGFRRELLDVIQDRNRRPRFEIYRFTAPQNVPESGPSSRYPS